MKKTLLFFMLFINFSLYCQNIETSNIYLQEFNYNSDKCFKDDKNNVVFFSKYYSDIKLKTGLINIKDTIALKNLKERKGKYVYYIKRTHSKDTTKGIYDLKEFLLTEKYDTVKLKEIVFSCLPKNSSSYECDNYVYQNVVHSKLFSSTGAILTIDNGSKKIRLRLLKEDCSLAYSEEFSQQGLRYSDDDNFLALEKEGFFIFIFDRFLR